VFNGASFAKVAGLALRASDKANEAADVVAVLEAADGPAEDNGVPRAHVVNVLVITAARHDTTLTITASQGQAFVQHLTALTPHKRRSLLR
jgi:hypothetical protein